jgi:transcriptional regulator
LDESEPQVEPMLKAIVGFRIEITRLEGKWKLNQNHPVERRRRVIRVLSAQPDADSQAIAARMREDLDRHSDTSGLVNRDATTWTD